MLGSVPGVEPTLKKKEKKNEPDLLNCISGNEAQETFNKVSKWFLFHIKVFENPSKIIVVCLYGIGSNGNMLVKGA